MIANSSFAAKLDEEDPLRDFRARFIIPTHQGKEQVYFLGNSLGLQPVTVKSRIEGILQEWADLGVEAFFMGDTPWMDIHQKLLQPLARIMGCLPAEISVMNQLTVNLHLMMVSFYRPEKNRYKILCEGKAFPSDQYMIASQVRHHGFEPDDAIVEVHPRDGEHAIRTEDILQAIEQHGPELSLVLWGGVNYYTGQCFDMQAITAAAQKAGAKVGLDLAHAAGNVPLQLHDWNVDFACWCNYKYLNGGPGTVGAAFIHDRYHADGAILRFAGWWGNDPKTRFQMEREFTPIRSAEGWQLSTPSPILLAGLLASLEIFEEAGWTQIQAKRQKLSQWLRFLLDELNDAQPTKILECITPRIDNGSQMSLLMLQRGREIFDALTSHGFITDWREPDVIRLAPAPLYNTYSEVWRWYDTILQTIQKDISS